MCKVYTGYCGTSEIEHGLCTCTVDNPRAYRRTNHALSLICISYNLTLSGLMLAMGVIVLVGLIYCL